MARIAMAVVASGMPSVRMNKLGLVKYQPPGNQLRTLTNAIAAERMIRFETHVFG
jgi:hypothetical protein